MHRFDFSVVRRDRAQRADAEQRLAIPQRPEGDVRCPQMRRIETVGAAEFRVCARRAQMEFDQRDDARIVEAAFKDCQPFRRARTGVRRLHRQRRPAISD